MFLIKIACSYLGKFKNKMSMEINTYDSVNPESLPSTLESLTMTAYRLKEMVVFPNLPNLKYLELKSVTTEIDMNCFRNLETLKISCDGRTITFKNSEDHNLKSLDIHVSNVVDCNFPNLKSLEFWEKPQKILGNSVAELSVGADVDFNDPYFSSFVNLRSLNIHYGFTNEQVFDFHKIFPRLTSISIGATTYHDPYGEKPKIKPLKLRNRMWKITANLLYVDENVQSDYFELGCIYDNISPVAITKNIKSSVAQITFKPKHYKFISIMKISNGIIECTFEDSSLEVNI